MKKKLLVLALAIAMMFTSVLSVSADGTDGSITVDNATPGTSYSAYKLFDLTYSTGADGKTNTTYYYTATDTDLENDLVYQALIADGTPFVLTDTNQVDANSHKIFSVDSSATADAIVAFITSKFFKVETDEETGITTWTTPATTGGATLTPVSTKECATGAKTVEFTGLPYGYYFVTSSLGAVASLDSTMKAVTIADKNVKDPTWGNPEDPEDPSSDKNGKVVIEKDASGNEVQKTVTSAHIGDEVTFSVAVDAVSFVEGETTDLDLVTYYYITDTLEAGKWGQISDLSVKVGSTTLSEASKDATTGEYTANDGYRVVYSTDKLSFVITVPYGDKYNNETIEVRYTSVLLADCDVAGDGNYNKANFTYDTTPYTPGTTPTDPEYPDPEEPTDPKYPDPKYPDPDPEDPTDPTNPKNPPTEPENERETDVYTFAVGVHKVNENIANLAGATFSLTDANGNQIYATATSTTGVYKFSEEVASAGSPTLDGNTRLFEVDGNGMLTITGLKEGTYTFTEEVAPSGYKPASSIASLEVKIASAASYVKTYTRYYDATSKAQIDAQTEGCITETVTYGANAKDVVVINTPGSELPSTGGIGTTIFYVLGGLMVAGAAVMLITRKRMD